MRHVTDAERRARLGRRHALAAEHSASSALGATEALTVLHATEAPSVYLSLWARVPDVTVEDVDAALYDDRSLVKQLAMRRTLFVFPRDLLPAAWGSASARVATAHRTRLVKDVQQNGIAADGEAWLRRAERAVTERLADGSELSSSQLREEVPELAGRLDVSPGTKYGGRFPIAPRVLTQMGLEASLVRGRNAGHWRVARPLWTSMSAWLGGPDVPAPLPSREGYAALVRRWLRSFGPGTAEDLRWWLGATKTIVRDALADVGAVQVGLDAEDPGWLLLEDLDEVPPPQPWVALLPVLDPSVMGWKERRFYLGDHGPAIFDSNGNAGTTAWVDGRVVGCWVQDDDGVVRVVLLEEIAPDARAALEREAVRLTEWLAGHRVSTVYPSPAMKDELTRIRR